MLTEHIIPSAVRPMPLTAYIRRAFPLLPGHAARDMLKKRDIRLDGQRVGTDVTVRGGMKLTLFIPGRYDPAPADLLFDDGKLLVCVKPQGLPTDADRDGVGADTLLTRLQKVYPNARLCNRLDAGTGGIVLAANDSEVYEQALDMFRAHSLTKVYDAVVKGGFRDGEGTLTGYLIKDAKAGTVRVIRHDQPGSRLIETRWRLIGGDEKLARVELTPVTGRTHQLRAHMADFGHPILMDDKYGDRTLNKGYTGQLRLWCRSIEIGAKSPLTAYRGKRFTAAAPEWFAEEKQ